MNTVFKKLTGTNTKPKRKIKGAKRSWAQIKALAESLNCEVYSMGTYKAWGIIDKTTRHTPACLDSMDCYYNARSVEDALETIKQEGI